MAVKKKEEKEPEKVEEEKEEEASGDDKYSELEKKVGEMSSYINETNEFIQGASVVINTLAYTPELRTAFQEQLKKQYGGVVGTGQESSQQPQQEQKKVDAPETSQSKDGDIGRKVDEVVVSQRGRIIEDFEKEHGISSMKEEERKKTRQDLEGWLNKFGASIHTSPLPTLRENLEEAYFGTVGKGKLKEEGKLEGLVAARVNAKGLMSTIGGGVVEGIADVEDLTDKQKAWATKLGVDPKKAKKRYFAMDQEKTRESKAEKKAKE